MKQKILFVDDHSTTLLLEQMLCRRSTYSLISARDAGEAIQKALTERPKLILMDANPANINACGVMRKIKKLQHVPIILVTTGDEHSQLKDGQSSASKDEAGQPHNWTGLIEMVNTFLTDRSAQ